MLKINCKNIYFICFIALLICNLFSLGFDIIDELIEIVYLVFILLRVRQQKIKKIILMVIMFFIIGFLGNVLSIYKRDFLLILKDFLLIIKFPIVLLGVRLQCEKIRDSKDLEKMMYYAVVFFSIVIFFDSILALNGSGFLTVEYKKVNGLYAFSFFTYIFCYHRPDIGFKNNKKSGILFLMMNIVTICLLTSTVAAVMLFAFVIYILRYFIRKHYKKILVVLAPFIFILVCLLTNEKIQGYFLTQDAPRRLFYYGAYEGLTSCFPIGFGFSLFGGKMAAEYYSPIYFNFGWNSIWAVMEGSPFLLDTFFPAIIGETGLLGTVFYFLLSKSVVSLYLINKKHSNSSLLIVLVFISGISSNMLNSVWGVVSCFIFGVIYLKQRKVTEENKFFMMT